MTLTVGERVHELEGVLHEAAGRLSPTHVAALVAHPDAVRSALAVAADMLAAGDAKQPGIETIGGFRPVRAGAEEARGQIEERICEGAPEKLLTSDELAARVGLKRRRSWAGGEPNVAISSRSGSLMNGTGHSRDLTV